MAEVRTWLAWLSESLLHEGPPRRAGPLRRDSLGGTAPVNSKNHPRSRSEDSWPRVEEGMAADAQSTMRPTGWRSMAKCAMSATLRCISRPCSTLWFLRMRSTTSSLGALSS